MKLARFRTNILLWIFFSSIFFISAWLVPLAGKGESESFLTFLCQGLRTPAPEGVKGVLLSAGIFAFVAGVPAVVLGWLAQSLVAMFRSRRKLS